MVAKKKSNKKTTAKKKTTKKPTNKKSMTKKSTPKKRIEKRTSQRVPVQLLVDYKSDGNYLFDFSGDLGTGGVFIETPKPQPKGSKISLTFTIPDSKETLTAKGIVIWSQAAVKSKPELSCGMGIQFEQFSFEQRERLNSFIERLHGQKLKTTNKTTTPKAS